MFDSVCDANFSKAPPSVNIILNKILFANVSGSPSMQHSRQSRLCPSIHPIFGPFRTSFRTSGSGKAKALPHLWTVRFWALVLTGRRGVFSMNRSAELQRGEACLERPDLEIGAPGPRFRVATRATSGAGTFREPARPSNCSPPWKSDAEDARTPNATAWSADSSASAKRLECVRFIGAFRAGRPAVHGPDARS